MKINYIHLILLILSLTSLPAYAESQISEVSFQDQLGRALNRTRQFEDSKYAGTSHRQDINPIHQEKVENPDSLGSWRLEVNGSFDVEGYGQKQVYSNKGIAVVTNFGDRYEFIFLSQKLQSNFLKETYKSLEENLLYFKEGDDALQNVAWEIKDGSILVGATHNWNGDANTARLEDQLMSLLSRSRRLIGQIIEKEYFKRVQLKDELEDKTITSVNRLEFEILVDDDNWGRYYKGTDEASNGTYRFTINKKQYQFNNFGNRLEYIVELYVPKSLDMSNSELLLTKVREWAVNEGAKDDPEITAEWRDGSKGNQIHIILNYDLKKDVEGEDLHEWYEALYQDFGPDANEEFDDFKEDQIEAQSKNNNRTPTSINKADFLAIIDDGLEAVEDKDSKFSGGQWSYTLTAKNKQKYEVVIINHENEMELHLIKQLPALGEVKDLLPSLQKELNKALPKHANNISVISLPGYETSWFYVSARYEYDGKITTKEIEDAYVDFMYDWISSDERNKIQKVFEKYGN